MRYFVITTKTRPDKSKRRYEKLFSLDGILVKDRVAGNSLAQTFVDLKGN